MQKRSVKLLFTCLAILLVGSGMDGFKDEQIKNIRVEGAYKRKYAKVKSLLESKGIEDNSLQLYIRVFKKESVLELWGKNTYNDHYQLLKEYRVCRSSGKLGPKRKKGDMQVPEGFYHISTFNPWSKFHLSLGINYPNKSDRVLGMKGNLGGDIFIHGSCVTIGCVPITDDKIEELYVFCVEAKNHGQSNIPVTIFPTRLNDDSFGALRAKYIGDSDRVDLWTDLKKAYGFFEENKKLPSIKFLENGRHQIN